MPVGFGAIAARDGKRAAVGSIREDGRLDHAPARVDHLLHAVLVVDHALDRALPAVEAVDDVADLVEDLFGRDSVHDDHVVAVHDEHVIDARLEEILGAAHVHGLA